MKAATAKLKSKPLPKILNPTRSSLINKSQKVKMLKGIATTNAKILTDLQEFCGAESLGGMPLISSKTPRTNQSVAAGALS
jgi:hypothetical protein